MFLTRDQWGHLTLINAPNLTHRVLKEKFHGGSVQRMYVDAKDGKTYQVGYVVGQGHGNMSLWVDAFEVTPMRQEV